MTYHDPETGSRKKGASLPSLPLFEKFGAASSQERSGSDQLAEASGGFRPEVLHRKSGQPRAASIHQHRETKKQQIMAFFEANLGMRISSAFLHFRFGSAVRTRISEICRDEKSPIVIRNEVKFLNGSEQSCYWSERK